MNNFNLENSVDFNNMLKHIVDVNIPFKDLQSHMEDYMTIKQIEEKYGNKIQQMPNGLWWIRLENGKVVKLTKRENVIKKIAELEKFEPTIKAIWKDFFEHRKISKAGGTVRIDKRNFENYIINSNLSNIPLSKITLPNLEAWAKSILEKEPIKERRFESIKGTLSKIFQYAIQLNLISFNPVEKLNIHRDRFIPKKIKKETDEFFLENEEKIIKILAYQDYKITKNSLPLAIPFLFLTGIRDGELCALHWRDIEGDYLHIQSEIVEKIDEDGNFNGYIWVDHCKSQAGDRFIPLSKEAKEILQTVKKNNLSNGFPISQDDFIFLRKRKNEVLFCTSRCFESRIKKYCGQAKMEVLKSQHDVRRTFATNLYYLNMPIKNISKLMGHESIEQTEAYIKCRSIENDFDYMELLSKKSNSEQIGTKFNEIKKERNA